jgi:uncharacterized protein YyaL (SSP411 family)
MTVIGRQDDRSTKDSSYFLIIYKLMMLRKLAIGVVLAVFFVNQSALAAEFRFSPRPNKAHLIKWRHWGKESFDEAKKNEKLILLSLSAIWCHWCHVMDETTYSDMDVIDYINKNFVPVRVDADMRPDVDSLYNQGGWPSTVILTPDGEIVQGGTYISQEAMKAWLSRFAEMFENNRNAIKERIEAIKKRREAGGQGELTEPRNPDIVRVEKIIESAYDKEYGGFGESQKFPNPDAIDFLLSVYQRKKDPDAKTMITVTLDNMSRGKIYDGVEGGFFRYSTMSDWSAPHYEKMLGSNADLIRNYASAYMVFGKRDYKKTLNGTIAYIKKYLYDGRRGSFFGSQDADEAYYMRTKREGVKPPYVDRTVYADSNARMITALVAAYDATGKREYLEMAGRAAVFIVDNLYSRDDGVYHYSTGDKRLSGLLSDNVLFGLALIDLYNTTGESRYLDCAEHIAYLLTGRFYDNKNEWFRTALGTTGVEPTTAGLLQDYNSFLSNSRSVIFLSRLYQLNSNKNTKEIIDSVNSRLRNMYERYEPAAPLYGIALLWSLEEPLVITVIADGRMTARFLAELDKIYLSQKVVKMLSLKRDKGKIVELGYPMEEAVYVCWGKKCSPAFTRPDRLIAGIKKFLKDLDRTDK